MKKLLIILLAAVMAFGMAVFAACADKPAEEPDNPKDLVATIDLIGGPERILFASDWPHHDFDHPSKVHQIPFSGEVRRKVFGENALRLFKIDAQGRRLNLR